MGEQDPLVCIECGTEHVDYSIESQADEIQCDECGHESTGLMFDAYNVLE